MAVEFPPGSGASLAQRLLSPMTSCPLIAPSAARAEAGAARARATRAAAGRRGWDIGIFRLRTGR
ncbi:hypothetical protein MHIMP23_08985 [Methylobacterium hispanicum]